MKARSSLRFSELPEASVPGEASSDSLAASLARLEKSVEARLANVEQQTLAMHELLLARLPEPAPSGARV